MWFTFVPLCFIVKTSLVCLHVLNLVIVSFEVEGENIIDAGNNCMGTGQIASVIFFHKSLERRRLLNVGVEEEESSTWYILTWVHSVTDWRLTDKY